MARYSVTLEERVLRTVEMEVVAKNKKAALEAAKRKYDLDTANIEFVDEVVQRARPVAATDLDLPSEEPAIGERVDLDEEGEEDEE